MNMELKENLGLILIVIGLVISLTMVLAWIGVPIAAIGTYLLYKKVSKQEEQVAEELQAKKDEMDNIDEKLRQMEKDKEEELRIKLADKEAEINSKDQELRSLQEQLALAKEEDELQTYGLYEPHYDFENATAYKEKLDEIRSRQKQLVKEKKAAKGNPNLTYDGDLRKGQAIVKDNVKQIIRTFNTECDGIIRKVKHSNMENSEKRIRKSYETLNRLNERIGVRIQPEYLNLKLEELHLAYEYEVKKQEEKELLAEAREREREEKKLRQKLEKEKNKFNRENDRINNELSDAEAKLQAANDEEKARLEAEIAELKAALEKNNEEIEKIDKWEETPGAGYVYIISNIGSFGEDVFKIGVTRRDDPEERIRELSNASVPFKYDSHVFIFSEDAYNLESSLHERFDKKRVNKINRRKEFFNIGIDDVKQIVEENKASVHSFVEEPEAEEYYDSLKLAELPE